ADCVMNILKKKSENIAITENDWQKLFLSEGYLRLKKREEAMKSAFTDSDFKSFVLSDTLRRKMKKMEKTLEEWKKVNIAEPVKMTLAYLPQGSTIKAKIFIEIKPRSNSFVFDLATDPAIFLYLDTEVSKENFINILAHELHHVGYNQNCGKEFEKSIMSLPENQIKVINWIGAFGEGFAMVAAAGGADVDPHLHSPEEDRKRWNKDVMNFNDDLKKVETFFLDVLNGKLTGAAVSNKAMEFFGIQGPWYTVGWKMSMVIEKIYGHNKLLECIVDQRKLLPTFNKAVIEYNKKYNEKLCTWSDSLIKSITD
ncbi:MAG: hypothetical protein C0412_09510, partial [Flavobacterium sp.]|nr:hypothetical protein [Flavobacterium sp.]